MDLIGLRIVEREIIFLNCLGYDIMVELDGLAYPYVLLFSGWKIEPIYQSISRKNKYGMIETSDKSPDQVLQQQIDTIFCQHDKKIKILVQPDCKGVYRNIKVPIPYLLHEEQMLEKERNECRPIESKVYSLKYFHRSTHYL
jgi:uncharacterized protein YbaR (Trm112 family)